MLIFCDTNGGSNVKERMVIETGDARSLRSVPHRRSQQENHEIEENVCKLLKQG